MEQVKTTSPPGVEIQERGEIYFFYRPKVGKEEAHGYDDVQRMYIILRPHHSSSIQLQAKEVEDEKEKEEVVRLIVMGRKRLPDMGGQKKRRPFWGFVELVTNSIQDVKDALKGEEYDTKKRGHRHKKAPARALGEGIYCLLKHHINTNKKKKMHTHLVYKLQLPPTNINNKDPQEALNVEKEASYLIQIKNPVNNNDNSNDEEEPKRKKKKKKKQDVFPAHLQAEFGKVGYHAADPPEFLNYQGCEFLLISASDNIQQELGLELKLPNHDDHDGMDASCSDLVNTFGDLAPTDALLKGIWV